MKPYIKLLSTLFLLSFFFIVSSMEPQIEAYGELPSLIEDSRLTALIKHQKLLTAPRGPRTSNNNANFVPFKEKKDLVCQKFLKKISDDDPNNQYLKAQEEKRAAAQEREEKLQALLKNLGNDFLHMVFYPWLARTREEEKNFIDKTKRELYPDLLLACALETSSYTTEHLNSTYSQINRYRGISKEEHTKGLTKILASGLCSVLPELQPEKQWCAPLFKVIKNARVNALVRNSDTGLPAALCAVLEKRSLRLERDIELFLYFVNPKACAIDYCDKLTKYGKVRDPNKRTPLMQAAIAGHQDIVKLIIEQLDYASSSRRHYLVEEMAHKDKKGYNALAYARIYKHPKIVELLDEPSKE